MWCASALRYAWIRKSANDLLKPQSDEGAVPMKAPTDPMPTHSMLAETPWQSGLRSVVGLPVIGLAVGFLAALPLMSEPAVARSAGSVQIVAMVGDRPITNFQVDARAGLLLQQSRSIRKTMGQKAQSYFKSTVQKRWKAIAGSEKFRAQLRDYVMAKQPTSREEQQKYIKEYARKRQKQLQKQLQAEARNHGMKAVKGTLKKKALESLIDENLKLYEAKRMDVLVSQEDAKKRFASLAKRNKKTLKKFEADLRKGGIEPITLRDKIRADESWRNVIRKQFGFQLAMMQSALDRYIGEAGGGNAAAGTTKLAVKRIRVASAAPGAGLMQALQQAEALRGQISSCDTMAGAASTMANARLEDLGSRPADGISNPVVRELLSKAKVGQPIPPQIDGANVDVWVLCGRERVADAGGQKPAKVDPRQKEFETLARRHLNDLRREVRVEYR